MDSKAIEILEAGNAGLHREMLDNGMICLVKKDSSAPVASLQIWVRTGSIHEDRMLGSGLSHAIEHMIFKGAEGMSPGDVFRLISNAGGHMNAYTSFDRTVFHVDLPAENWTVGLDILSAALKAPAFPEEEWEKERDVILREFAMGRDDPHRVLDKLLWRTAFSAHPYRFPVIGIEEQFRNIGRDDLFSFFRENYVADNMITVLVGDVDTDQAMTALRDTFKDMPSTPRKSVTLPQEPRQLAPRRTREPGEWNISRCEIGYHTTGLSHPDAVVLDVIAQVIGHGKSSRFVKRLREERQLVNSIAAYSYTPQEPGLFGIYAEFDPLKEAEALAAINEEIDLLLKNGFTQAELEKARKQVFTSALSTLQTSKGQANSCASGEFYAADPCFATAYLKKLDSVSVDELLQVARKYLTPENQTSVLIVPQSQAETASAVPEAAPPALPARRTTPSGITVITREDRRLPFVYICAALKDGFLSETDRNCGITRLMSDMLLRGSSRFTSEQLAEEIESRAGSISPFSGLNSFGLRARCLSSDAPFFMQMLADCLTNPAFEQEELEKQRRLHLAAIEQERERPVALAQERLREIMFPAHPYRFSPLGTKDSVATISRELLQEFHAKLLAKNRMVVSVFGDISAEDAEKLVEEAFDAVPSVSDGLTVAEPPQFSLPAREVVESQREQTIVLIGCPSFEVNDPRTDALMVLDEAMSGLSSTMAAEVREKRGLAYFVGSYQQLGSQIGAFVMYAGTRADARDEVERIMIEEAGRVTTQGLTEEEFGRAVTQLISASDMALQNNSDMAMKSALDELVGKGHDHSFKARERFNNLTIESVRDAAAAFLKKERMASTILIPETGNKGD